mmetsp:Transcript_57656/g.132372  ORF Transcript_57656/g.132372 Transcript_57656/m.132372 type:complete len:220 (+) Transcript_57656:190-849(+)
MDRQQTPRRLVLTHRTHQEICKRLHAPVQVEDAHHRHVIVLLPTLCPVECLGSARAVPHVDEHRRRLDVRVVAVLVGDQVVRVVARAPPFDGVALPQRPEKVAGGVVPMDEPLARALDHRMVQVVVRGPAREVEAEADEKGAKHRHARVQQPRAEEARHEREEELERLVNVVSLKVAELVHLLCECGEVAADGGRRDSRFGRRIGRVLAHRVHHLARDR